jgi:hypothetical protein
MDALVSGAGGIGDEAARAQALSGLAPHAGGDLKPAINIPSQTSRNFGKT